MKTIIKLAGIAAIVGIAIALAAAVVVTIWAAVFVTA